MHETRAGGIITCVRYNDSMRKLLVIVLLLGAACAPPQPAQISSPDEPLPYRTITPSATAGPTGLIEFAQTPLPSPTPFNYTIKAGDTLGGIADHFNVSLDSLLSANPDVSPNAMSIGQTLKIPSTPRNISGEGTPTPAPFAVQQISCHPTAAGQLWCLALAYNDLPDPMEDVTAQFTLLDPEGGSRGSQRAVLPLNILPPHQALPLTAFFTGVSGDLRPQVQVLTAVRLTPNDPRYLPAAVQNTQVQVDWSGLSAQASGQIFLPADAKPAASVWVAAVAYDRDGRVVGVRRWESSGGLQPGSSLPFSMYVSSVAGEIERVDFAVEARP
jgi:LysM repeat protein